MFTSSDLIAALLARRLRRLSLRGRATESPPGEFPPGWKAWFASMRERVGAVTGATADAFLAILVQREPALPPRAGGDLTRWQTFATFWRSSWEPAERDSRGDRVAAGIATLFVHLAMLVLWAWLIYVRVPPAPAAERGDAVVQVEFIGRGTPEDTGGGAPAGETPQPEQAAAPQASAATPTETQPEPEASAAVPPEPQPEPEQPAEVIQRQPLQVSETQQPDARFVLPPTTPPDLEPLPVPRPQVTVQPRERTIELAERPTPPVVRAEVAPRPIDVPTVRPAEQQVRQREIPLLAPPRELPQLAQPSPQPARVQAPERAVRGREITLEPAPAGDAQAPAATTGTSQSAATAREGTQPAASDARAGGQPEAGGGERPTAAAGRGAEPAAAPGAWPTPTRGDDWGEALRDRPGGNAGTDTGLFDDDGRPRLPPGTAQPGGGFPPGSDDWTRDLLDRHGTWATRPPLGYEPTRFDRYWIPSGTLLQEWVRRGIKQLSIPIPGTTKKIICAVSILQLGGGCGITDPNLQDQEAVARPPPDIPFKPELQEDNGSR